MVEPARRSAPVLGRQGFPLTGVGLVTSVGLTVRAACAAFRAGIARPAPIEFRILDAETQEPVQATGHDPGVHRRLSPRRPLDPAGAPRLRRRPPEIHSRRLHSRRMAIEDSTGQVVRVERSR